MTIFDDIYNKLKKREMNMKKITRMMTVLLSLMMLSGCGQSTIQIEKDNIQKESVSLKVWGGPNEQELLAKMVENFKAEYADEAIFDISIESEDEGSCKARILSDVGAAPDVFTFADDQLMELAAAGVVEALEAADQIKETNVEGAVEAATINENIYAYPMTADNGYFMFYNKKYLSEEDVTTLDKMLAVAGGLHKKVTMDWTAGWYLYSFFGNTGLTLGLNPDGITNYCNWNSQSGEIKGIDVGNAMLAIANHSGFMNGGDQDLIAGAKNDSVIAGVSGIWNASELKEAWKDDFAAVKLPTYTVAGKQVQLASYAGYKMIGVNAYSPQKEWAAKLAQWLTDEENQMLRFIERGLGPSNKVVASEEEVNNSPAIKALIEQSEYASLQRVGAKYWEPVANFGKGLAEGSIAASNMQQAMDLMVKEITIKVTD